MGRDFRPEEAGAPGSGRSTSSALSRADAGATASSDVQLLAPGRPPRRKLRYRFSVGHVDQFKLSTTTSISVTVAGQKVAAPELPGVELGAEIRVLGLAPDGAAKREFDFRRVKVLHGPGVTTTTRTELRRSFRGFDKLTGRDEMTRRGIVRSVSLDASSIADPNVKKLVGSLQSAFGEMGAPFPKQAVGIGARWKVQSEVERQGIQLTQTATYQLVRLQGDHGSTLISLTQSAPRGKPQATLLKGASPDLSSMTANGNGQIDFDLGRLVPKGHLETQANVQVSKRVNGHAQDVGMAMTMHTEFEPLGAGS